MRLRAGRLALAVALAAPFVPAGQVAALADEIGLAPPEAVVAAPTELLPVELGAPGAPEAPVVFLPSDLAPAAAPLAAAPRRLANEETPAPAVVLVDPGPPVPFRPDSLADVAALSPPGAPPPFLLAPQPQPAEAATAVAEALGVAPTADEVRAAFALAWPDAPRGPDAALQRKTREAILAVYEARGFAALWVAQGQWTRKAQSALARLARASDDGLDLSAFSPPSPKGDKPAAALAEIRLSEAIVAYARQASGGRVDPGRVSSLITVKPETTSAEAALAAVSTAADPGEALRAFNPPHAGYKALRAKLLELRQERPATAEAPPRIPLGPTLKIGMRDPRVPLIRSRFGLDAPPTESNGDLVYDTRIASAIADFQRANGLPASGALTPRTIAALSGGEPSRLENEIVANMERWRWLPRNLGAERIEVNIPDYTLKVTEDGAVTHRARVVVGKPDTPTPVFSHAMQFLIVNPYWNVPPSIIKKEMEPNLAADPDYYTKRGYEVIRKGNQTIIRQPPGERNALGRIKFMFPNQHSVYLHDTPSRSLFGAERRAYSHGCVRVDQPFKLAEVVLGKERGWSEERVRRMIGGAERTVHLARPLPVHIQYFTAFVDDHGKLQLRDDIYGYSRRLKGAMGLEN
ncbi:MAG: L,D-transpeptidase family protein [Rhizobiales bacterium]|nr:L,D-transpeptidase family protein [Hyphomicrobiales bacterium]